MDSKPFWMSQRLWLTVLGVALVITLSALGKIEDLSAAHVVALVGALVLGKSLEQGLAK